MKSTPTFIFHILHSSVRSGTDDRRHICPSDLEPEGITITKDLPRVIHPYFRNGGRDGVQDVLAKEGRSCVIGLKQIQEHNDAAQSHYNDQQQEP